MYYFPQQPPYLLLLVGLLVAVTSGAALSGTLKLIAKKWRKDGNSDSGFRAFNVQLLVPFLGITAGVGVFLTCGLAIFGFPPLLACGVGIPVSLLTCLLVWLQLGSMLSFAQRSGGMQSLDLDSFR